MILARITRAIREQNWFAVSLEFVIVIAGVVIGFQIQGWSLAQRESDREAAYLARLHTEIEELQATREGSVSRRERNYTRLIEFADMLNGRTDDEPDEEHCQAIGLSFVVSNPTDRLAVLDELLSVGGFETIRSPDVRAAIGNYLLVVRRAEDANALSQADRAASVCRFRTLNAISTECGPTRCSGTHSPQTDSVFPVIMRKISASVGR